MPVHAIDPSSTANVWICWETEIEFHLTEQDDIVHVFCTERPRQRARHGASTDERVYDSLDDRDDV